ncbi:GcrA cell cycle regulator, partial [Paracraurococcus ruber]
MDWTNEAIEQLRILWAEGHSTAEIGRRMGVSKNAIVGKAHRLNLPARPSPIRRDAHATPRPAPAPRRPVAPPPLQREAVAP